MAKTDKASRIANLSPQQRLLLERRLRDGGLDPAVVASTIVPRKNRSEPCALSFGQRRLWFLEQMNPGGSVYNESVAMRLTGMLRAGALEQSLGEIVRRHEILRTSFRSVDGRPVQLVSATPTTALPTIDLRELAGVVQTDVVRRLAAAHDQRPFDLTRGPLLRVTLLRLADELHVLLLTLHHIVSDKWSMGIFAGELAALYGAFSKGLASPLPELRIQYADFAQWQRERYPEDAVDGPLDHWKRRLADAPALLELPCDRPRPAVAGFRGRTKRIHLDPELTRKLKALSRDCGGTLFMTLLAAFTGLLSRVTGQDDVVVGSAFANRNHRDVEPLIGFIVNTLVMRVDLSGNPSVEELLRRVRQVSLDADANQEVPFELLVAALRPERMLSHSPLFQVMFVFQNAPPARLELPGLKAERLELDRVTSRFDLTLYLEQTNGGGLKGGLEYSTELFDATTMARMASHLERLLAAAAADPRRRLSELPVWGPGDRQQVLVEWNDTRTDYPDDQVIHALFQAQAELAPDAVAVAVDRGEDAVEQITFRELNLRSDRLAHRLRRLGVGAEVVVGIGAERSADMIVGLLGILKAGGAYLPLGTEEPVERRMRMLEQARAAVLVTQRELAGEFSGAGALPVICLDTGRGPAREIAAKPVVEVAPHGLAYVMFTSGSSGRRKAVRVPHRSVVRLVENARYCRLDRGEVLLQLAPLSFDASTFEIWGALLNGARLALAPPGFPGIEQLGRILREQNVTTLWLTASLFHAQVDQRLEELGQLRQLLAGGEVLSAQRVRRVVRAHPETLLINGYGPTEATTFTCCHTVTAAADVTHSVAIGRPIGNTRVTLLDRHLRPVPPGIAGELTIAGDGLARDYLDQAALTSSRFIPDPLGEVPGGRRYKTGDMARHRPDGTIEFLGRTDRQVKLRGFRVEPAEIEAVVGEMESVKHCAVVVKQDQGGEKRLVCYVSRRCDHELDAPRLRAALGRKLPGYLVPQNIVILDQLPLTASGKVDCNALPEPDWQSTDTDAAPPRPATEIEQRMARTWAHLLKVRQVGIHDDFFELGGHSIPAVQLLAEIRDGYGVGISLQDLFETPTVAGISGRIEAALDAGPQAPAPPRIRPATGGTEPPLSFAQQRLWFVARLEPDSHAYTQAVRLELRGPLNVPALEQAFQEIERRHDVLRTRFIERRGASIQVVAPAAAKPLRIVDLSEMDQASAEEVLRGLAAREARRCFDLTKAPPWHRTLVRTGSDEHTILLTTHHVILDGRSQEIFLGELATLLQALGRGVASPLEEPPLQYTDFAAWQRSSFPGEWLDRQIDYWKQQLADLPTVELPTQRRRPPTQAHRGANQSSVLRRPLLTALRQLSEREGVTLYTLLLAAFQLLLHRYTNEDDVALSNGIGSRSRPELNDLIGCFINILIMRADLSGNPKFRDLLNRVHASALRAYGHQDLPFELLVEELQPERQQSQQPLFHVMLVLLGETQVPELPGLQLSCQESPGADYSQCDLCLHVREGSDLLRLSAQYDTELFRADSIRRLLGHFESLLGGIVADPERRISSVPLLPAVERHQVSVEWNDTAARYPEDQCLHQLFESRVDQQPDRIAARCGGDAPTCSEIDRRANRLARLLARRGIGRGSCVGVCLERSTEWMVSVLAVLKAGAAYVPMDPNYPRARLRTIRDDAGLRLILTHPAAADRVADLDCETLVPDAGPVQAEDWVRVDSGVGPDELAYVIYTSGTTGMPKGVMLDHRGRVNNFHDFNRRFAIGPDDALLAVSSLSFDMSAYDLLGILGAGARIVMPTPQELPDPECWTRLAAEAGVTIWHSVPALLNRWVEWLEQRGRRLPERLRLILLGGDWIPVALPDRLRALSDGLEVVSLGGATECSMDSTIYSIGEVDPEWRSIPYGRPMVNQSGHVLDPRLEPVPIGVPGELYLGGVGVAWGYLNRPDLTAEKFVPCPSTQQPGRRMYATGDRVRYYADGNLELLGRRDHQVKIRGFRVELGEITATLTGHALVRDALTVVKQTDSGKKQLVAYVIAAGNARPEVDSIKSFLRESLPDYMIPDVVSAIDAFPLTPNGKIDVEALPLPGPPDPTAAEKVVGPRNPFEAALVEIWNEVLEVEPIGVNDNFFDLGGHSLLATQVSSRIYERFQIELPLKILFDRPTVAELSDALQEAVLANLGSKSGGEPAIESVPRQPGAPLPLSYSQRRFWFFEQYESESLAYQQPIAVHLRGDLNLEALKQAFDEIVRRHAILRTTFTDVGGEPAQIIAPFQASRFPIIDLSALPEDQRAEVVRQQVTAEAVRPVDLRQGPVFRYGVLRLGRHSHVVLVVTHHIVFDGWSQGILVREIGELYSTFVSGRVSSLADPPVQYVDYAFWERTRAAREIREQQLEYWRTRLADLPQLELPTDRPRPPFQTYVGKRQRFTLSTELTRSLNKLGGGEQATLFMTMLAAFQVLLVRYTGQTDVVVSNGVATRGHRELEGLIGCFVNILLMRSDLANNPRFSDLLRQVRSVALEAYSHQDLPFDRLVEELDPERDTSRQPLFQVMLVMLNAPVQNLELPGLTIDTQEHDAGAISQCDLCMHLQENDGELIGSVQYNRELFDQGTIVRWIGHFRNLTESIVADPQQRLSELTLLGRAEQQRMLVAWNHTRTDFPPVCLHQQFEARVGQQPDAIAVEADGASLTYAELNQRANSLARHLRSVGVGPDAVAGVCLDRSMEMIVAVAAILKAGGAYMPLDDKAPADRLKLIVEDSGSRVVVTQEKLRGIVSDRASTPVTLDRDWQFKAGEPNLDLRTSPAHLAYVIYTSGSTGTPKGVMLDHRGRVNNFHDFNVRFSVAPGDKLFAVSPFTFDMCAYDVLGVLAAGATIVLYKEVDISDPARMLELMHETRVTVWHSVPALLHALIEFTNDHGRPFPSSVRLVLLGGDWIPLDLADGLRSATNAELRIISLGGATEASMDSTIFEIGGVESWWTSIPYGKPMANQSCYVLGSELEIVPIGVAGELHLGGVGLARGYVNDPALTAERYVPHPCGNRRGEVLYKTGDSVRYRPDGNLELLGRMDHQVKIRGFRVEPGEIETALRRHPSVKQVVVVVRQDPAGQKQLVAYLVPSAEQDEVSDQELIRGLAATLPRYMLPSVIVRLDALPLTPNHKIDRKALPDPDWRTVRSRAVHAGPRGPLDEVLIDVWLEVLEVDHLGIDDDFFELGGHSLLATRVVSRLGRMFQIEVPLRLIFERPTIRELASGIEELASKLAEATLPPPIERVPRDARLPLSFAQQRLWFLDRLFPGNPFYLIPWSLRILGPLHIPVLGAALREIVRRHEVLRTCFPVFEGRPYQRILPPAARSLPVADLSALPPAVRAREARRLVEWEATHPFDLMNERCVRFVVLRHDFAEASLLVSFHHIVFDGWSQNVFYRELRELYRAVLEGRAARGVLDELPVQYADFAAWQQRQLRQGERFAEQLDYWLRELDGVQILEIPGDRQRSAVSRFRGRSVDRTLDLELTQTLRRVSRRRGATLYMTLLAALQVLLHRLSGEHDVAVGSPIANRHYAEIEGLIGLFVNTLVLRGDLTGDPTFEALLGQAREKAFAAYGHQDIPFERLVQELRPERNLNQNPLFQVMLVLQNTPRQEVELGEVSFRPVEYEARTARVDLELSVYESREGLLLYLIYDSDLFDASTADRLLRHFQTLLEVAGGDPSRRLSELPILDRAARHQVQVEWNDTAVSFPRAAVFPDLFELQARRTPEAPALVMGEVCLSYAELNAAANRLAHHLVSLGVTPETRVGILLERSPEMMVAIHAALKAGAAYVPLDSTYPNERLELMLRDSGASLLLTHGDMAGSLDLDAAGSLRVVDLDRERESIAARPAAAPLTAAGPDNLAYVIYTSGSTGRPKGVQIAHRPLVNFLVSMAERPGFDARDTLLAVTTICFDMAQLELFLPLIRGGRVVVASREAAADGRLLAAAVEASGASVVQATPATWRMLVEIGWKPRRRLKVLCGGEALAADLASALRARGVELWNVYGPTETTVLSAVHRIDAPFAGANAPIGYPVGNTRIHLVDGRLSPVGPGVAGELLIGGDGLSRGYLGGAGPTAERFVPDPFDGAGSRLYKTGDLARRLSSGAIEYLGRLDHQVKIRGFRIELGEIEATLLQHPGIRQCAVIDRQPRPGDRQLVAYVVGDGSISTLKLRRALRDTLPDSMIPSQFVTLVELPKTPNGKVDRKALRELEGSRRPDDVQLVVPGTPTEKRIAEIWQSELGLEQVGVQDHFFDLGGHSLQAMVVVHKIESEWDVQLPPRDLFQQTLGQLATAVDELREAHPP